MKNNLVLHYLRLKLSMNDISKVKKKFIVVP